MVFANLACRALFAYVCFLQIETIKAQHPHNDLLFLDETLKLKSSEGIQIQMLIEPGYKDWSVLESGRIFGKGRPTFADHDITQVISVRDRGTKGDRCTDDTVSPRKVFDGVCSHVLLSSRYLTLFR